MKTISIPGFIQASPADKFQEDESNNIDGIYYRFVGYDYASNIVAKATLTFDVDDDVQSTVARNAITALEGKRTELLATTQQAVNAINEKISKLSALTYEVPS